MLNYLKDSVKMLKYRLIQIINPILRIFGYEYQKSGYFDTETFEVIYTPWELKKLKKQ
jgi:hypothetical protein